MPTCDSRVISEIIGIVHELKPKSILDVGIGFGKWGHLFREYLEVIDGRYDRKDWKTRIDGVEIFKPYLKPFHKEFYDNILLGDIRELVIDDVYDLIFIGDVIEHLEKDEAIKLIDRLSNMANVLITTPNGFYMQGSYNGNDNEIHRCGFSTADFKRWNSEVEIVGIMIVALVKCKKR